MLFDMLWIGFYFPPHHLPGKRNTCFRNTAGLPLQ